MIFLRVIQHLLPNARAWRVTITKRLREFFEGLSGLGDDVKTFLDGVWQDIDPETTRELTAWEHQFGLRDTGLTEQGRRDRLDATWKALGGQDPRYVQDTLRGAGFDVYVHEWWEPGTEPSPGIKQCVTPRDPTQYLRRQYARSISFVECGESLAQCGEVTAEAGNGLEPRGYPLVNKVLLTEPNIIVLCGERVAEAGEPEGLCGNYETFSTRLRDYTIPNTSDKWPYFLYIGGRFFGDLADVPSNRRDEFEALCLKICPAQQWLGILVEYS